VLVVEDDVKIADALRRGLQGEGFDVEVSHDGLDGLWRATEGSHDIVILDLLLPGKNGYQVCRELRDAGVWTPILILTAKDGELDETEALDTGADDYLTKPFSFPVLVAHLRALLRRSSVSPEGPNAVLDLTLDSLQRRCWRAGQEIKLTNREFTILEYFVRRAGAVQSKSAILDAVWDDDFDGDSNIVEVYIARLRRKVDGPFSPPLIETVRGAGYRLRDGS
jgi:two-component system OmpR family response regulator